MSAISMVETEGCVHFLVDLLSTREFTTTLDDYCGT